MIAWLLLRRLTANLLALHKNSFGLWGRRKVDGVAYQQRIRGEWWI